MEREDEYMSFDFTNNHKTCHMRLSFHEANILKEIARRDVQNKAALIVRLANLSEHTTDPILLHEISTLNDKILELSDEQFSLLLADIENGSILFPMNYTLPDFGV